MMALLRKSEVRRQISSIICTICYLLLTRKLGDDRNWAADSDYAGMKILLRLHCSDCTLGAPGMRPICFIMYYEIVMRKKEKKIEISITTISCTISVVSSTTREFLGKG